MSWSRFLRSPHPERTTSLRAPEQLCLKQRLIMGNTPVPKEAKVARLPAERPGESEVIRHPSVAQKPLLESIDPEIHTLYDAFTSVSPLIVVLIVLRRASQKWPDARCLGWREGESEYKWMAYKTVRSRALAFGSGLVKVANLKPVRISFMTQTEICSTNPPWESIPSTDASGFCLNKLPMLFL